MSTPAKCSIAALTIRLQLRFGSVLWMRISTTMSNNRIQSTLWFRRNRCHRPFCHLWLRKGQLNSLRMCPRQFCRWCCLLLNNNPISPHSIGASPSRWSIPENWVMNATNRYKSYRNCLSILLSTMALSCFAMLFLAFQTSLLKALPAHASVLSANVPIPRRNLWMQSKTLSIWIWQMRKVRRRQRPTRIQAPAIIGPIDGWERGNDAHFNLNDDDDYIRG